MAEVTTPRPRFDAGAIAGSIAATAVLVLWFVVEKGLSKSEQSEVPADLPAQHAPDPVLARSVAPATTQSAKPWQASIDLGREGVQQLEGAFKQHEKEGDPFRFRSQTEKAKKKLEVAIESLDAALEVSSLSAKDLNSIRAWRDHFAKALGFTRK